MSKMSMQAITDDGTIATHYQEYLRALGVHPWRDNATVAGLVRALEQEEQLCISVCPYNIGRIFEDDDGKLAELTACRVIIPSCSPDRFSLRVYGRYLTATGNIGARTVVIGTINMALGKGGMVTLDGFSPVVPGDDKRLLLPSTRDARRLLAAAGHDDKIAKMTRKPGCIFIHLTADDESIYELIRSLGYASRRLGRMTGRQTRVVTLERPR